MSEIFTTFGVTWATFFAQLLTVLAVYYILKTYAFGPIIKMLDERRRRIEEGQINAEKIRHQLADAENRYREILDKANGESQRMINEARESAHLLGEKRAQEAVTEAERIVARAREATTMEHDRVLAELKREVGRLVIETTAKVSGKVLTDDDQRRLSEETSRQVAA